MRTSASLEALLDLENRTPDALLATLPGTNLPIWPLFRQSLAQAAANVELGTIPTETAASTRSSLAKALTNVLPGRFSSTRLRGDRELLFMSSGVTVKQVPSGYRNWLTDPFAEDLEARSVVVQDRPIARNASVPTFPHTVSYSDTINRVNLVTGLLPLPRASRDFVREVLREIVSVFPIELSAQTLADLERRALFKLARARHEAPPFERMLDRVRPRIVLMEDASYGGRSKLIQVLKSRGIVVAELQHGWIGPYHTAYNFGAAMSSPLLKSTLPDVVLTFGDFWSDLIRHPARLISIGKPHLESSSLRARQPGVKKDEVLVVSSVFQRDELATRTLKLRELLPEGWIVRLRPHPSERDRIETLYPALVDRRGIEFDANSDVVSSLTTAKAVFGFSSTVLYEALAFDCQVFVIDSPLADYSSDVATFGERIRDTDSLSRAVDRVKDGRHRMADPELDRMWKPNALENFRAFVDGVEATTPPQTP